MKKTLLANLILFLIFPVIASGNTFLLSGRILLQVESHGEAWYINPADGKRYELGRPDEAFDLMREMGIGITNADLIKIPAGFPVNNFTDSDADGIYDRLEDAIGSNKNNKDTDSDGYEDKTELLNGYDLLGLGKKIADAEYTAENSGKIFLQVEKNGEAWYVEPVTQKRYFLGRPDEAFQIMKAFGLGITNADLAKIQTGQLNEAEIPVAPDLIIPTPENNVLQSAARAIRSADTSETLLYFTSDMQKSIEYSMEHMAKENLLLLGNILQASSLTSSTETKKTYSNEIYFQGVKHTVNFYAEKQPDGKWLITNL